jgi:hypothetical protein
MQQRSILSESEQQQARQAFRRGFAYLVEGKSGNIAALNEAIIYLSIVLEWAMPDTWPTLWMETRMALNEALHLRGDTSLNP